MRAATRIKNLRYELQLTVPDVLTTAITGTNTIRFDWAETGDPLVIDFATSREHVLRVLANGRETAITWINGHIVLPAAALRKGANVSRRRRFERAMRR